MILTCDNVTAKYSDRLLFSGLGFSVGPGSLMLLCGENGSGKTTLLKMLAGLHPLSAGCITCDGENIRTSGTQYSKELYYLGHQLAVKPQLTVRQNI